MRVALIGGGAHGLRSILTAANTLPGWGVAAVVDPDATARERAASVAPAARAYEHVDALVGDIGVGGFTSPIDLVVIATPPAITPEVTVQLMGHAEFAGSAVLVEKPGAIGERDLDEVVAASERHAAPVHVAYSYRHHPTVLALRQGLADIGSLRALHLSFHAPLHAQGWRARRAAGGGALRDLGSHLLDLAHQMVPGSWTLQDARFASRRTDDDDVRLRFAAGAVEIEIAASYHGRPCFRFEAHGQRGRLIADLWRRTTPAASPAGGFFSRLSTMAVPSRRAARLLQHSYIETLRCATHVHHPEAGATLHDARAVLRRIAEAEESR